MSLLKSFSKLADTIFPGTGQFLNPDSYSGKKQQENANAIAMQAWNLANDYNSPKSQVERLVAADLNPYLVNISGNTAGVPGISGGNIATEAESSFRGLANIMNTLQGTANLQNTRAQTTLAGAQTGLAGAQALNAGANAEYTSARAEGQRLQNKLMEKQMIADIDYKKQLAINTSMQNMKDYFGIAKSAYEAQNAKYIMHMNYLDDAFYSDLGSKGGVGAGLNVLGHLFRR